MVPLRSLVILLACVTLVAACVGPTALHRSVLAYDETTLQIEQQLLLLNIARWHAGLPLHFTTTSNIAATFDWTKVVGVGGRLEEGPRGFHSMNLNLGASASENPTFSIVPLSGEEFTKRLLTPLQDKTFEFIVYLGRPIDQVMRLTARGIQVQGPDGSFVKFIENHPRRPDEYREFRQIALHLAWLQANRQLFVRSLVFEDILIKDVQEVPEADDIGKGLQLGLTWRQKSNGHFQLTKLTAGRVVVTNFDPDALSNQEKWTLNEKIKKLPAGFVYVDIRPDYPGGKFPLHGAIKLRSFSGIISFLADCISKFPEFAVQQDLRTGSVLDPRTGRVGKNPRAILEIKVTNTRPPIHILAIDFQGKYYSVADTDWDRDIFRFLAYVFQTTVAEVKGPGIPITIAK